MPPPCPRRAWLATETASPLVTLDDRVRDRSPRTASPAGCVVEVVVTRCLATVDGASIATAGHVSFAAARTRLAGLAVATVGRYASTPTGRRHHCIRRGVGIH